MRVAIGAFLTCALLAACAGPAMSSIGLAEWSVRTPGGAIICHLDGWKEQHGDCLRSPEGMDEALERQGPLDEDEAKLTRPRDPRA